MGPGGPQRITLTRAVPRPRSTSNAWPRALRLGTSRALARQRT